MRWIPIYVAMLAGTALGQTTRPAHLTWQQMEEEIATLRAEVAALRMEVLELKGSSKSSAAGIDPLQQTLLSDVPHPEVGMSIDQWKATIGGRIKRAEALKIGSLPGGDEYRFTMSLGPARTVFDYKPEDLRDLIYRVVMKDGKVLKWEQLK